MSGTATPIIRTNRENRALMRVSSFGWGWTLRLYSKAVSSERRTFRTTFRDNFSSRQICLIGLP